MKKVILLGLLMFSLIGCNSDDDDNNGSNPETFLVINNGSIWKYVEDEDDDGVVDGIMYLKFNNSLKTPYDWWESLGNHSENWDCYSYFNFKLNSYDEPILFTEIIENTPNKFTTRITLRENHYQTNIITKSGDRIKLQIIGDEMGHDYGGTYYFDKTSDNLSDLELCN